VVPSTLSIFAISFPGSSSEYRVLTILLVRVSLKEKENLFFSPTLTDQELFTDCHTFHISASGGRNTEVVTSKNCGEDSTGVN
jgi:hypothetical protein